ncbi:DUF3301 domain-containing protein [Paraglaciecola aquimarina]|uniref:DUF3301 domain-containing protein n=1 Tax=Paraglaciecola aquimarina TaxID=1235557 RepID=A0ABU3T1I8_9ALTE|nr:DUF3301 domain-containing protein [Paraglaciecola aquimarina]MDU0356090.1 DUF3301 domain-containing protein [Paraglaciecola aquimarina]
MNLYDLILFIVILVVVASFWRLRAISESVKEYLDNYCEQRQLQLISVARNSTRIGSYRGKLDFQSSFVFEFSGNGEECYQGKVTMAGLTVLDTDIPAYRVQ